MLSASPDQRFRNSVQYVTFGFAKKSMYLRAAFDASHSVARVSGVNV
jgi:hypothetical protein